MAPDAALRFDARRMSGRAPLVSCDACGAGWYSRSMAEGLRLIGTCSRCGGALTFGAADGHDPRAEKPVADVEPQHVFGVPRGR